MARRKRAPEPEPAPASEPAPEPASAPAAPPPTAAGFVRITCDPERRLERVPLAELLAFQGALKELSAQDEERLRAALVDEGYAFPTSLWHGHRELIDGHQRNRVLSALLAEGFQLVELDGSPAVGVPVVAVVAADPQEAARKVLAAASVYGRVTYDGLFEFARAHQLDVPALPFVSLPEIDLGRFAARFNPEPPDQFPPQDPATLPTQHRCPKCGYEWSGRAV